MAIDPLSLLYGGTHALDASRVATSISQSLDIGRYDALRGVGLAVDTGLALGSLLAPSATGWGRTISPVLDSSVTLESLSQLRRPYDSIATMPNYEPYRATVASLAATSGLATSLGSLAYPTLDVAANPFLAGAAAWPKVPGVTDWANSPTLGAIGTMAAFRDLMPSALAATGSVYNLESAYQQYGALHSLTDPIYGALAADMPRYGALRLAISTMATSAMVSWDRISGQAGLLAETTAWMATAPALEIYSAAHAAGAITLPVEQLPSTDDGMEELISSSADAFEERLASLSTDLVEPYRGGVSAIEHGAPDWRRHAMNSFRELITHVLDRLAPVKAVLAVATADDLDKHGRPTRRARMRYVFAGVVGGELSGFFQADLDAALELFELLHGGTHRLGSRATPEQLRYVRARVVGLIDAMLEAQGY